MSPATASRALFALLIVAGLACGSTGPSLPECTGPVSITATTGAHPRFTWTPSCQLEGVVVALPGPGAVLWSVSSTTQRNTIAPGVTYGRTPAQATVGTAPGVLTIGASYTVTLFWLDDGHGGSIQSAGSVAFVP